MSHATQIEIVNGPSKMDLMSSLSYCYRRIGFHGRRVPFLVEFTMDKEPVALDGNRAYARVTGLVHEDGSGESFEIRGELSNSNDSEGFFASEHFLGKFSGFYNSRSRSGLIEINLGGLPTEVIW